MEIIEKLDVSELTKQNYKYKLKKLISYKINPRTDEQEIIDRLNDLSDTYNTINAYLNVVIIIRKHVNLPIGDLVYFRDERRIFNEPTETNKKNIENGLPSYSDLHQYMADEYEKGNYKSFIINYLILHYNVRNKDLDLVISDKKENGNCIVLDESNAIYIRQNYKTFKTYGIKQVEITEPAFIYACYQLGHGPLLKTKNHNQEIKNLTYEKIGQGRYFKSLVKESDVKNLKVLSNNRGTAVGTIVDYYAV